MVNIVENTLRDGSYTLDFKFTKKHTHDIVSGLDKLGFEWIEVGHGLGLGAYKKNVLEESVENDVEHIKTAKLAAENAKIGAFFIPGIGSENDLIVASQLGLDFLRIGVNVNDYKSCERCVRLAKQQGLFVTLNLMKSYGVKPYEFCEIAKAIDRWQLVDVLYLVDSAGCMLPFEVTEYIDRVKQSATLPIGFHGHNNLSLALANTISAMQAGATYLDSCVRGMGRSAGNTQTEILVWVLAKLGVELELNMYELYKFADEVVAPLMSRKQGLSSEEIHIGVSKFHSSYMPFVEQVLEKHAISKELLIKKTSDINCLNPSKELFEQVAVQIKANE